MLGRAARARRQSWWRPAVRSEARIRSRVNPETRPPRPIADAAPEPFLLVLVAAVAVAFQLLFYDRWVSLMDEGHMLQFADLIAHGGALYRDATVYPLPGAFYLLALVFRVAGESILVARRLVVIEFSMLAVLVFVLLRRFVPRPLAFVGVGLLLVYRVWAFPHWHMYSYSSTALCLLAGARVFVMRFLETGDLRQLAIAGVAAGSAALCRQDYGVAALAALNGVLVVRAWSASGDPDRRFIRPLAALNGPGLALAAVTTLYFWRQGLLLEMARQTFWNHLVGIATFSYTSLPPIRPLVHQDHVLRDFVVVYAPSILFTVDWTAVHTSWLYTQTSVSDVLLKAFYYGPYLLLAWGAVRLWRLRDGLRDPDRRLGVLRELTLFAFAAALLLSLNKPRDYIHVVVLYWPVLCLLVVYAYAVTAGRRRRARAAIALACLVAVPVAAYTGRLAWLLRAEHTEPLRAPRAAGVLVKPEEKRVLDGVLDYIDAGSAPTDTVAVFPYFPLVSFLAERRGPNRSGYVVWPVPGSAQRDRDIIAAMEATDTRLVVYHTTQWVQFPPFEQYAPELFAYLVDRYEMDRVFTVNDPWGYVFIGLHRRDGPREGRPLAMTGPDARVWVEAPDAPRTPVATEDLPRAVAEDVWPFTPVVALRPLAGGRRTVLTVPTDVPPGTHLRTAVGIHPRRWIAFEEPSSVTFTIEAERAGRRDLLFSRTIDPERNPEDRGWTPVDVPLPADGPVTLEFSTTCEESDAESLDMGGWAAPRLVVAGR